MTPWQTTTLGECVKLTSGGTPSKAEPKYWGGDIPWVSAKDLKVDRIYDSQDHVTEEGARSGTRKAPKGSILLLVRGMALANEIPVALAMREVAFNQDVKALQAKGAVDTSFLFYWLKANEHILLGTADEAAHGTKRLQTDRLLALPVRLPKENLQRRISGVLAAYDNLIENNTRRIKLLEQMAELIYREWFVNFRFPGHEDAEMVESELGLVPEGWGVRQIQDSVEVLGGGTPSTKQNAFWAEEEATINWFTPSDLTAAGSMFVEESERKITPLGLSASSARLFPAYSVMMTSRATIGVVSINTQPACTNQGFIVCIPSGSLSYLYLYFWLHANMQAIEAIVGGATFKEVRRTLFKQLPILVPTKEVMEAFNAVVGPISKLIENLLARNKTLRQTRDMLLPKLISGELDVSELQEEVGSLEEAV